MEKWKEADSFSTNSQSTESSSQYVDTAVHISARLGDADGLQEALQDPANDVDAIGIYRWCALHESCANTDEEIVFALLQAGATPWLRDALHSRTALHYAAEAGDRNVLEAVVECCERRGLSVSDWSKTADDEGKTPIDLATGDCAEYLSRWRLSVDSNFQKLIADFRKRCFSQNSSFKEFAKACQ